MSTEAFADEDLKTTGQLAFEAAYDCLECHGKGPDGRTLLTWRELSPEVQDAWQAAANKINDVTKQQIGHPLRLM